MATTYEGTMPSLLQGVSQQIPRERQPGQLGAQLNMLSDPVTGIRRRPPAYTVAATTMLNPGNDRLFTAYIERGTDGRHLLINTVTGAWQLLSKDGGSLVNSGQSNYLIASIGATSIQTASVNGLTYILNTEQIPNVVTSNAGKLNPANTGFYTITSQSFSKIWDVTVTWTGGTVTGNWRVGEVGDDGSLEAAPANAVAAGLLVGNASYNGIKSAIEAAGGTVVVAGNSAFITGLPNCAVSSGSGTTDIITSNQMRVNQESDLPANLPSTADGAMCAVGTASADKAWYQYSYANRTWNEVGAYGSVSSITNMPLELAADDNILAVNFEGRLAGDDDTNADPAFVTNGYITGIAAFQGRLVLLSGAGVSMSASALYQRFYRSTVSSLLSDDRIDIASASAQDSVFRRAIQFNRDLVVFGDSMQAVIPGGSALSPTNASITLTSEFSCDSRVGPIVTGQTVLYPNRRNADYAGLLEFIPSAYTSSQYVSQDATVHLPRYIPGRIMEMHVSSVTNIGFVRYSGERNSLLVYEFMWGADGAKSQAAYHKWQFQQDVLSLHAQSESMYLFIEGASGYVQLMRIDPREGFVAGAAYDVPYMDAPETVTVTNKTCTLPASLQYSGITAADLALAYPSGDMAGSEVGIAGLSGTTITLVNGTPNGTYSIGLKFPSSITLTPPMLKDKNDNLVGSGHVRLLRLDTAVRNTGEFFIEVSDTARDVDNSFSGAVVLLNSKELELDNTIKSDLSNLIIPCRTNSDTTDITFSTSSTLEMNILDVSYILRYNQRRQRV